MRIVPYTERGLFYSTPFDGDWANIGLYIGQINRSDIWSAMAPDAIKVRFGRCHQFGPGDDGANSYFPWTAFLAYDAAEVAAGQPSLLITAGGQPVYIADWMALDASGKPTTTPANWGRPVNIGDDRFIDWWLANYVRPIALAGAQANTWLGLDGCSFKYSAYGVLDSSGVFHNGATWDAPYPQNDADYVAAVEYFFSRVKALAPDLHVLCNEGTMDTWSAFPTVYAHVDGIAEETMEYDYQDSPYLRLQLYNKLTSDSWAGAQGKVTIFKWMELVNDATMPDQLRRAYCHYLLLRGDNSFFDPQYGQLAGALNNQEVPPSAYWAMAAALGLPVGPLQSSLGAGQAEGYRLYWRQTQGGIVYLNWTGTTQTVSLPAARRYVDRTGAATTQLTIADRSADFALYGLPWRPVLQLPHASPHGLLTAHSALYGADGTLLAQSTQQVQN